MRLYNNDKNLERAMASPAHVKLTARLMSLIVLASLFVAAAASQPSGPEILSFDTEIASPQSATNISTVGGSITTMLLNGTTQNPHWKAYVGNITGQLVLRDAGNYSIYEWSLADPQGEVYVSRNDSITWTNLACANSSQISDEETAMNHTSSADDSISNTFTSSSHDAFYTGSTFFSTNECGFTTATYVNNTQQSTHFQEVALSDGNAMMYATLIDPNTIGFDYNQYDFQVLVPEKGWEGPVSTTTYYFWLELH